MFKLSDALEAIKNKPEFAVKDRGSYTVIDYVLTKDDTFIGKNWDETLILLNLRGTAFDNQTGQIIRLGYHKFMNYGQIPAEDALLDFSDKHVITQKMDGCFSKDTVLKVRNKKTEEIKFIKISEIINDFSQYEVFSYCENQKIFDFCEIKNSLIKKNSNKTWILLEFENINIECTSDHKFLTHRGWIKAEDLLNDDEVISFK